MLTIFNKKFLFSGTVKFNGIIPVAVYKSVVLILLIEVYDVSLLYKDIEAGVPGFVTAVILSLLIIWLVEYNLKRFSRFDILVLIIEIIVTK